MTKVIDKVLLWHRMTLQYLSSYCSPEQGMVSVILPPRHVGLYVRLEQGSSVRRMLRAGAGGGGSCGGPAVPGP